MRTTKFCKGEVAMVAGAPSGNYAAMKVVDVMTAGPLTVTPSDTVGQADEMMAENRIRQIPVVEGKRLVGIITDRDIRSFLSGPSLEGPPAQEDALNTEVGDV